MNASNHARPRVLILTPVYNEEAGLAEYERVVAAVLLSRPDYQIEVLFIDDGSRDRSWELVCGICARDTRFRGIRLSRNYGSHVALSAGFGFADADCVATLACDLQDPPETILKFLERWRQGARIVWGKRRTREDTPWRVLTSNVFYRLMRRFAMPAGSKFTTGSFLLLDRTVVDCVRQFQETSRIVFALVAWTGFNQEVVEYDRKQRMAGKSGWNFGRMFKTMYDAFVGFSYLPIRLMTLLGAVAFFFAAVLGVYTVADALFGNPLKGWASTITVMAFFFGIQFILMGVSGEYLYRIYLESVKRPLYFISDRTGGDQPSATTLTGDRLPAKIGIQDTRSHS